MSHLLLQTKVHLQLHEEDTLAHVEGLLQVVKGVVDVILDGALLIGQFLQDLSQHQQGRVDLWQAGSEREKEREGERERGRGRERQRGTERETEREGGREGEGEKDKEG